jgi:hypothetical protein
MDLYLFPDFGGEERSAGGVGCGERAEDRGLHGVQVQAHGVLRAGGTQATIARRSVARA